MGVLAGTVGQMERGRAGRDWRGLWRPLQDWPARRLQPPPDAFGPVASPRLDSSPGWAGRLAAGLACWWRSAVRPPARLALVERIPLGPRQSLALVEAEGLRLLVATSADGTPAFFALPGGRERTPVLKVAASGQRNSFGGGRGRTGTSGRLPGISGRVSW